MAKTYEVIGYPENAEKNKNNFVKKRNFVKFTYILSTQIRICYALIKQSNSVFFTFALTIIGFLTQFANI